MMIVQSYSTSPPGGNQVDGLPPAASVEVLVSPFFSLHFPALTAADGQHIHAEQSRQHRFSIAAAWVQHWCSIGPAVQYSAVQRSTAQCSAVQHSAVLHSAAQCSTVQCSTVQHSTAHCSTMQCSAVQCSTVQYSAVHCSTVQCSTVKYSAVQCRAVQ